MLAKRLQLPFFDADARIEQRIGCSIRDFAEGEARFRDIEEEVIDELSALGDGVLISAGGGAVLRAANRQRLRSRCKVVYLHAQPEDLARRLAPGHAATAVAGG